MRKQSTLFLVLALVGVLSGCSLFTEYGRREASAQSALEQGHYEDAARESIASLKDNAEHGPAREILLRAYPLAIARQRGIVEAAKASRNWDRTVEAYRILVDLNERLESLPGTVLAALGSASLGVMDYSPLLRDALGLAAEKHYLAGKERMARAGVRDQRAAAGSFARAYQFVPNYKDSVDLYQRARAAGTERWAFLPFRDRTGSGIGEAILADLLRDLESDSSARTFAEIIRPARFEALMRDRELVWAGILRPGDLLAPLAGTVDKAVYGRIVTDRVTVSPIKLTGPFQAQTKEIDMSSGQTLDLIANYIVKEWEAQAQIEAEIHVFDVRNPAGDRTERFTGRASDRHSWAERQSGNPKAMDKDSRVGKQTPKDPPEPDQLRQKAAASFRSDLLRWLRERLRDAG